MANASRWYQANPRIRGWLPKKQAKSERRSGPNRIPHELEMPVGIGALGSDSQKRLQVRLDRARIATPRQAFQLDEVEMRPDKPRLPRHDLIEGFLRALGFHLHQKPRLEVAGQELVRSPSIELERAVILVGTKRLNSSCLSMCGQWLVSVTGLCAKRVRARGERSGFSDAGRPPSRRDRLRGGRLDRQDSRTGTDPATSTRSRYNL